MLAEQIGVRLSRPGCREINVRIADLANEGAVDRSDAGQDDSFRDIHHAPVIAVGLVQFEHREFGIVPGADALIPEHPAKLVNALQTPDEHRLRGSSSAMRRIQVDIQRVVMRDKRPGGGPAGDGLQRRSIDFKKPLPVEILSNRLNDGDALLCAAKSLGRVNQVEISVPQPILFILHSVVLGRMRLQRLREECQTFGPDGRFAGTRPSRKCLRLRPGPRGRDSQRPSNQDRQFAFGRA